MHAMERYFSQDSMRLTDEISVSIMRTVIENAPIAGKEPENYNARANIMWAASLAQNGLAACGSSGGDWVTHCLANELGGVFDTAHGAALSAVWGSWARYVYEISGLTVNGNVSVMFCHPEGVRYELNR